MKDDNAYARIIMRKPDGTEVVTVLKKPKEWREKSIDRKIRLK